MMVEKYNPDIHHRRSIRLKGHDYSQAGAYFVTICAWKKECLFGDVLEGEMKENGFGQVVQNEWTRTAVIRPNVELDYHVVMPNHFHGIMTINECDGQSGRGVLQYAPTNCIFRSPSQTIGAIIRGFKSTVTKHINEFRKTPGLPVWQRNYYEHIIRTDDELNRIREYIVNNPARWAEDEENPGRAIISGAECSR
ncbi:MAG: hypothetical protein M0Z79_09235 [Nitrospiraceae bacterium]|nr:hypothetical protein [Nitrospiraceae bacterium]